MFVSVLLQYSVNIPTLAKPWRLSYSSKPFSLFSHTSFMSFEFSCFQWSGIWVFTRNTLNELFFFDIIGNTYRFRISTFFDFHFLFLCFFFFGISSPGLSSFCFIFSSVFSVSRRRIKIRFNEVKANIHSRPSRFLLEMA